MAKKHRPKDPGQPGGGGPSGAHGPLDAIRRLTDRMARQGVPDEELNRYMNRLARMLREWREFRLIRPDTFALQRALRSLPEDQFQALLDPAKGARRSRRARAHLFTQVFDAEIVESLVPAITEAAQRAGSPDDAGALAVALYSLRTWADGSRPLEANPLFAVLLDVSFDEFHDLTQALKEVEAAAGPPTGQAEAQPPTDDAERQKRVHEAIAKHPAFQRDAECRAFRLGNRLLRYVERGVVRAHLTPDELGALADTVRQATRRAVAAAQDASGAAAPADPAGSMRDLLAAVRAFAADPANDGAFRRFTEELAAEAKEAAEKALPLAEHLAALAEFCQLAREPASPVRVIICQASLARVRPESEAGSAREAQSEQGSEQAPPA